METLTVGENAKITIEGKDDPYISIGQEDDAKDYTKKGIFIGIEDNKSKLALRNMDATEEEDDEDDDEEDLKENFLSWNGKKLIVKGKIETPGLILSLARNYNSETGTKFDKEGFSIRYSGIDRFEFFDGFNETNPMTMNFQFKYKKVDGGEGGKKFTPIAYKTEDDIIWGESYPSLELGTTLIGNIYGIRRKV